MTLKEAKDRLKAARNLAKIIRKDIQELRDVILKLGGDPDKPEIDLTERNKKIYKAWKSGKSFAQVARVFNLSSGRIAAICRRFDRVSKKRQRRAVS